MGYLDAHVLLHVVWDYNTDAGEHVTHSHLHSFKKVTTLSADIIRICQSDAGLVFLALKYQAGSLIHHFW